jgi:hypothetical protein
MSGTIYFVAAPGRIKIGYTCQPEKRLKNLRQADVQELTVIATVPGNRPLEHAVLARLDAHRLKGEWFKDCAEVWEVMSAVVDGHPETVGVIPADRPDIQAQLWDWDKRRDEILLIAGRYFPSDLLEIIERDPFSLLGKPIPLRWQPFAGVARGLVKALELFDQERAANNQPRAEGLINTFAYLAARHMTFLPVLSTSQMATEWAGGSGREA